MRCIKCSRPEDLVSYVARVMTSERIRHLPVEEDDHIVGLVSIGDILKHRIEEMQLETRVLRNYAISSRGMR